MEGKVVSQLKKHILVCIEEAEKELKRRKNGELGDGTEEEIRDVIIPELNEILLLLEKNQLPEQNKRYLNSFACAFTVWGWDIRTPSKLFSLLRDINDMYGNIE